ncbi:hypothetical protein [Cytobacillus sp. IB215665]|uniref:hypothetical protein n=1 Tax=Cytobacillus sp. IB215665 TaxID=3097357 RepID=UPI002A11AB7A|nr:hypothetical protein [Cytobacillus sp. IB215665]MDX8365885.1 hypothetical protein [Cytobacillus sp. IB215665]
MEFVIYALPIILFVLGLYFISENFETRRRLTYPLIIANIVLAIHLFLLTIVGGWVILGTGMLSGIIVIICWLIFIIMSRFIKKEKQLEE